MATKKVKKNERDDSPSRVKVPHIGPRPRSTKPGTKKRSTTRSGRKK